jgi:hypothetical protein
MTIHRLRGPVGGKDAVDRALNHLFPGGPSTDAPLGGGTAQKLRTSQPIPVFRVDLGSIHDPRFLLAARPVGWRYLVDKNGPAAVADIRETSSGEVVFGRVTRGLPAKRLLRAAQQAEDIYADETAGGYALRILDIPALSMSALWLHAESSDQLPQKQEVFFPIMSGQLRNEEVQEDSSFVKEVICAATVKRHEDHSFLQ